MKKLLFMTFAMLLAFASRAGDHELWLYWMVDASGENGSGDRIEFYGANLYVIENGEGRLVDSAGGTGTKYAIEMLDSQKVTKLSGENEFGQGAQDCLKCLMSDISGVGIGAQFYVELLGEAQAVVGVSDSVSMEELLATRDALTGRFVDYLHDDTFQHGHGGELVFTAFTVPEPTSGLLVLLGVALMALRRRRQT